MSALTGPSARHFALLRIALGGYVAVELAAWVPHAELLLQARALVPVPDTPFPSVFDLLSSVLAVRIVLVSMCGAALLYAAGIWRRGLGLVLWYAWACLVERFCFLAIPSDGYVGWLLLASSLIPSGETLRSDLRHSDWQVPREIVWGAWLVLAASYTVSGLDKLASPSWTSGATVASALASPAATPLGSWLGHALPAGWLQLATFGALGLECSYGLLCSMRRTRRWAWYGAVAMHLSVLAVLQIGSVSIGMLIFHAFIFDPAWLPVHARQAVRAQFGTRIGLPPTALAVNPKSMP